MEETEARGATTTRSGANAAAAKPASGCEQQQVCTARKVYEGFFEDPIVIKEAEDSQCPSPTNASSISAFFTAIKPSNVNVVAVRGVTGAGGLKKFGIGSIALNDGRSIVLVISADDDEHYAIDANSASIIMKQPHMLEYVKAATRYKWQFFYREYPLPIEKYAANSRSNVDKLFSAINNYNIEMKQHMHSWLVAGDFDDIVNRLAAAAVASDTGCVAKL
jgi:hypothetical protein